MPLLTPEEEAAGGRLPTYNERDNTPTNPRGFGRGGSMPPVNLFIAALRDVSVFCRGVVRSATEALAAMNTTAARFEAAVAAIRAGPVSSVNGQSGAVVIDLSTLSAEVEEQLAEVRAAQAALVSAQADITDSAQSYALAFGG